MKAAQDSALDSSITSSSPSTIAELQKEHSMIMINLFSAIEVADAILGLNDSEIYGISLFIEDILKKKGSTTSCDAIGRTILYGCTAVSSLGAV